MNRNRLRTAAVAAVLGATTLGLGTTALAAPMQSAQSMPAASNKAQVQYGYAAFKPYGEHLYACDTRKDGLWVKAQLKGYGSVVDSNGSKSGCGHKNFSIKEGKTVHFRVCVESVGCFPWTKTTA